MEEQVDIDVRYRGNRLSSPMKDGGRLDFVMLFWFTIIIEFLEDQDIEDPADRLTDAVDYAFDELPCDQYCVQKS